MKLFSPAKLNLGLWIVGRRPDGYHLLESLFCPIDLVDEIEIERSDRTKIAMHWDDPAISAPLPKKEENILYRMLEKNPSLGAWNIAVRKRIPMGGGLGGGSSNAGTVLKYFVQQKLLSLSQAEEIAVSLGADVPFFLNPVPSWVRGIGEVCTPLPSELFKSLIFLLVLPEIHCATPEIFKAYRESGFPFSKAPTKAEGLGFLQHSRNDLESIVVKQHPMIRDGIQLLKTTDAVNAALSGSGSTFYAIYRSDAQCEKNAKDVQQFCRKHHCRYIKVACFQGEHHGNHRGKSIPS